VISRTTGSAALKVAGIPVAEVPEKTRPMVGNPLQEEMANAFRLHQAGDLPAAARLYQGILARDANHADACHLLGVLRHQQGQHAPAVELIAKAVALRPGVPAFHANLAEAYRALGQFDRAVGCCRTALQLWRDYPEAHNNLGLALQALGKTEEAVQHFEAALALRPGDAMTHSNLGTALRTLGQADKALEHFRKAVELSPKLAIAQSNLGQFLLDLGKPDEALGHCKEAVTLQPNLPEAHNNLGNAYRALGQYTEARASYFEALRINPDLTQAHANLGLALQQEGRLDEAFPWFQRATELEPNNLVYLGYFADAATEAERPSEAIECYRKMIELDPSRPLTYNNLGWLLQEEGKHDEAKELYETALRIQPEFAPALVSMGGLLEELGKLDDAQVRFRTALEHQPGHTVALARLATLLRGSLPDEDLAAIEQRIADPNLPELPRATLLFGLAHVLDARKRFDEAAKCLRDANAVSLAELEKRKTVYVPTEHERFITNMITASSPEFFTRLAGSGLETKRPIFVFGLPRSGTTLVEQVLASHSQVHGAGELLLGRKDFEAIPALMNRPGPGMACYPDLTPDVVHQLAVKHDERLRELSGDAPHVTDKMPDNYMYAGLLALMFPHATFVHCRRDLRDIAISCWMTNFRSIRWANSHEHIASRFKEYLRVMDHWRNVLPVTIHEVDYEETVDDLEAVARRLIAACGLPWEPACLQFHENERPIRTASVTQVRQPVYKKSVARWKNYETELAGLLSGLPVSPIGAS
jgi:tetratricopeptide (TPR) repeat protein